MARLIELQPEQLRGRSLELEVRDILCCSAIGGRVQSGNDDTALVLLGVFVPAIAHESGEVIEPMGTPSHVLFQAVLPGRAVIELYTGGFGVPRQASVVEVTVVA